MIKKIKNPFLSYENKWVVLTKDGKKVVDSDSNVKKLQTRLEKLKIKKDKVVMTWVPSFDGWYSP